MLLESCGWGSGHQDPRPPIGDSTTELRSCREAALRLALETANDVGLGAILRPLFERSSPDPAQARLLRFLGLADRLVRQELPRLRRLVRCEAHLSSRWAAEPAGGRVEPVESLRRSGGAPPTLWLVRRTERFVRTPVNRLIAAVLRRTAAILSQLHRSAPAGPVALLRRERSVVVASAQAFDAFLATSPLGSLGEDRASIETLRRAALPRQRELRRVASLLDWWTEFSKLDLQDLRRAGTPEAADSLSVHACYEQVAALSLLLTLRERLAPLRKRGAEAPATGTSLRFHAPFGEVKAHLGCVSDEVPWARPATLLLELRHRDGRVRHVYVEARNSGGVALQQVKRELELMLRLLQRDGSAEGAREHVALLIAPTSLTTPGQVRQLLCAAADLQQDPRRLFDAALTPVLSWEE